MHLFMDCFKAKLSWGIIETKRADWRIGFTPGGTWIFLWFAQNTLAYFDGLKLFLLRNANAVGFWFPKKLGVIFLLTY